MSIASSIERQNMREQLDSVRQTLNSLAGGTQQGTPAFEAVLSNIATKLNSIEGLYSSLTDKLERVDLRVEDSEQRIKDLQSLSATAIHETARLASTPPSAARVPLALEYVPGHMSATIQQHAAQIHKLIAGLDFLEAHIIRQDQVVEGLQKQLMTMGVPQPTADSRSPSELALRVHDMAELLNKLRSHTYKVEKKSGAAEQEMAAVKARLDALEARVGPPNALAASEQEAPYSSGPDQEDVRERQAGSHARPFVDDGDEIRRQLAYLMAQLALLSSQVGDERTATASSLAQLQEQVTAASSAASCATACAQLLQEQQAAFAQEQRQDGEAFKLKLQEQVAGVMEQLKEQVDRRTQQMDEVVTAVNGQMADVIRGEQLETALQPLRASVADAAERGAVSHAALENMRSELIVLIGQQDMVQSRLDALEAAVGVEAPRVGSPRSPSVSASQPVVDADDRSASGSAAEQSSDVAIRLARVAASGGSLLGLAAQLQARVGGLESTLEAAAADMEQIRERLQSSTQASEAAQESIQQAMARLAQDLQGLEAAVGGMDERVAVATGSCEAVAAQSSELQGRILDQTGATNELAERLDELQARLQNEVVALVHETSSAVASLTDRITRDYIHREQLVAIFQARSDMKRAVDELSSVFDTGRLLREAPVDNAAVQAPSRADSLRREGSGSGALSPKLVSALEDLAGKQAELEHQVHLALYRCDNVVRQEQLVSMQQAMMTLEVQFKRLATAQQQPVLPQQQVTAAPSEDLLTELAELRGRVQALEAALPPSAPAKGLPEPNEPTAVATISPASDRVHLHLLAGDDCDEEDAIRVRLVVHEVYEQGVRVEAVAAAEKNSWLVEMGSTLDGEAGDGEPSLSQLLSGEVTADDGQALVDLRRTIDELAASCETLQSELAAESAERLRLAESLADLQERLDSQVNASASTAAMIATMVTDRHVRLQVRVGADTDELTALSAAVSTLSARVEAAEESLAAAFIVRSPRSPGQRAADADVGVSSAAAQGEDSAGSDGAGEDEGDSRPALGLMVPVIPHEMEEKLCSLEASISLLGARIDGLEAADALEDVRAAASEVVLEAIPGMVSQQVAVVREEVAAATAHAAQLAELATQAARDAAEAVLAVREISDEASAAREATSGAARTEASTALATQASAVRSAVDAAEAAARDAAVQAAAATEAVAQALAARNAVAATAAAVAREVAEAAVREAAADAASSAAASDVLAAQTCAARLAADAAEAAARDAAVQAAAAAEAVAQALAARDAAAATAAAVAREVAEATARDVASDAISKALAARTALDSDAASEVAHLGAELKQVRAAVNSLTVRLNDVDVLRDQLGALAEQVRSSAEAAAAAAAINGSQAPETPTTAGADDTFTNTAAAVASIFTPAATALVIPPARTPRPSVTAGTSPGMNARASGASQQAAFLAKLVEVVKGQTTRLHAQYSDAEETGAALSQVEHTLDEVEARLKDERDTNSSAFTDMFSMVLEQVAALRYIGSQTHPAIQQMVLEHENRLDQVAEQLKGLAAGDMSSAAAPIPAAVAAEVSELSGRVVGLEAEVIRVAGRHAALDRALNTILETAERVRAQSATATAAAFPDAPEGADGSVASNAVAGIEEAGNSAAAALELAVLSAKILQLDESMSVRVEALRKELRAEMAASGDTSAAELRELDSKVTQLHTAATAMRNRLLAMQEYVDSTQGMIKDMHVAVGGLHRKVDVLESASEAGGRSTRISGSSGGAGTGDLGSLREIQSDLSRLEGRLRTVEASSVEAAHTLAGLKSLAPRVTEAEARLADAGSKLAVALGGSNGSGVAPVIPTPGPGVSLPVIANSLRQLERRVGGRLEVAYSAMDALATALSDAGRIQAESTANPFKAISAAVNNPVVVALEKKVETVRVELLAAASTLLDDMKRDQREQREGMAGSRDVSISGGSGYGGLSFRS
ncbi:hypothetical protein GPECTOR_137g649 [Gonium pectorale]|uniref:Uncharacterized protein n=1 Tax=Gonium pectorale TaxID=33097 RepID=A0A150FY49_GONPE|nr:hypothetical protein GPECTOR_137g649 [Gonium pectorale]|eukprot:KXZ42542.1 hypothetical protein GPECTOR_137g649 [Gonium pectorale]